MSTSHDAHESHDAHDAHDFDGEPIKELPADEPLTPSWLPVLGFVLFFAAGIFALSMGTDDASKPSSEPPKPAPQMQVPAAPEPQNRAPAQLPGAQVQPNPNQPIPQTPPGVGSGAMRRLSPDEVKKLQERIEAAKAQREQSKPQPVTQ
jgi:hypothetical protein